MEKSWQGFSPLHCVFTLIILSLAVLIHCTFLSCLFSLPSIISWVSVPLQKALACSHPCRDCPCFLLVVSSFQCYIKVFNWFWNGFVTGGSNSSFSFPIWIRSLSSTNCLQWCFFSHVHFGSPFFLYYKKIDFFLSYYILISFPPPCTPPRSFPTPLPPGSNPSASH